MIKLYTQNQKIGHILDNIYFHGNLEVRAESDKVYYLDKFEIEEGIHKIIVNFGMHEENAFLYVWITQDKIKKGLIVAEDDGLGNEFALKAYRSKARYI